ncbi:hypothetical protein BaRGS_00014239 [Batillaria attramentaria]|uniref:Apple domain-containing protein n=1 Tax=Batillaria attramentaria TaxID=370345 RepID=A0ABD0L5Q2_9CAEN
MRRVSFAVLYHLLSVVFRPSCAVIRQDVGVRSSDVADLIFTQDLLWSTSSASLSACAVNCFTDDNCVSFTTSLADQNGNVLGSLSYLS